MTFLPRKILRFLFGVLLLIIILQIYGYVYRRSLETHWQARETEKDHQIESDIREQFANYLETTRKEVEHIWRSLDRQTVADVAQRSSLQNIFEGVTPHTSFDFSTELIDDHYNVIAWSGMRGPSIDSSLAAGRKQVNFLQGPIYTYLVVLLPLDIDTTHRYFFAGKRLFDVNYPINNQFINSDAFASVFNVQGYADTAIDFDFSHPPVENKDPKILSVQLLDNDGSLFGYAYVPRPQRQHEEEQFSRQLQRWTNILLALIVVLLAVSGMKKIVHSRSMIVRGAGVTAILWMVRYIFLWLQVPQSFTRGTVFQPALYSSTFGFGIAGSIGDMCISTLILLFNIIYLNTLLTEWIQKSRGRRRSPVLTAGIVFLSAVLVVLLLRACASIIHGAVFESVLAYNDPTFVLPPFELGLMLLNLLGITFSILVGCTELVIVSYVLLSRSSKSEDRTVLPWIFLFVMFVAAGVLSGVVPSDLLFSTSLRIIIIVGVIFATILVIEIPSPGMNMSKGRTMLILFCSTLFLLVPLLDRKVHELDRSHVETFSSEIVRPVQNWLSNVVNQALDQLSSGDAPAVLSNGSQEEIGELAFTQWASSILSREGNNCSVVYMDKGGKVVSSFHIGPIRSRTSEPFMDITPTKRFIDVDERNLPNVVRWYRGYTPVTTSDGTLIGGVWIELSTGKQLTLRGEAPEILKNYSKEHFQTYYRKLDISEYYQDKLIYSTNETFPRARPLPASIVTSPAGTTGIWFDETVDGKEYETYAVPDHSAKDLWITLSMESLDVRWHLYSFLRYILFYGIFGGCFALVVFLFMYIKSRTASFKTRLTVSFIIVSLIPLVILAYYNRQYAEDRAQEATLAHLEEETSVVAAAVQGREEMSTPFSLSKLTDQECESIADQVDIDFSVYLERNLQASSKPEMVVAQLLDDRLSANGFVNIILRQKNFFWEEQSIGKLPYIVGYRPLLAENGDVIGVVSVPTLYRQSEISEELTRRNVFLFGAYALALAFSLIVGSMFAKGISSPVLTLKEASRRIAKGDLDVNIQSGRNDEIGELERAFDEMTHDLRRSQEEMAKVQRELAWKEMAKQIAHEIKNPLTPMRLSLQHLRQLYADNVSDFGKYFKEITESILQQIETLSRIASEFSNFARMPERTIVRCSVNEILNEVRRLFEQYPDVSFTAQFDAGEDTVDADREELRRVFINIIRNAVQSMKEKGSVSISTSSHDGWIEVTIVDSGPGIPKEVQVRLFEPYFSTKTDGMGLGLSIVKKTLEDFGGTIAIESIQDSGTTVRIRLPFGKAK